MKGGREGGVSGSTMLYKLQVGADMRSKKYVIEPEAEMAMLGLLVVCRFSRSDANESVHVSHMHMYVCVKGRHCMYCVHIARSLF